jgi:elongation factor Ts
MLNNISFKVNCSFLWDNTLLNQDYIKDNKLSVANYVKSLNKILFTGFKELL